MIWKARLAVLPLALLVAAGGYAVARHKPDTSGTDFTGGSSYAYEQVNPGSVRVIDGDTVAIGPEHVRLSDLDAPEMPGRAHCEREARLALAAKAQLTAILSVRGAHIGLIRDTRRPLDRYGRTLGRIIVNGQGVASPLISAGVARPWRGRSSNWCGVSD